MQFTPEESQKILGMTLADYANWRGKHPQGLRQEYGRMFKYGEHLTLPEPTRITRDRSPRDLTETLKFTLPAGFFNGKPLESESVIIPMTSFGGTHWFTLCVSSQIGCRMACSFCETGRMGLLNHLLPAQIVQQRLVARQLRGAAAAAQVVPQTYFADGIQNVVFMGMGEPFDNFDNVVQAIRVLTEPAGLNFPLTQITVSTVGRVDGLRKMAAIAASEPVWRNLRIAISLNAATDQLRDELMPVNKGMPLAELRRALLDYPLPAKGRFLVEYVLIKSVNDSPADAAAVAEFCRGLPCIVNVIPYNPQRYAAYETPTEETILAFMVALKAAGIFVKRRVTHGRDLMGACGQLGNPEVSRKELVKLGVRPQISQIAQI